LIFLRFTFFRKLVVDAETGLRKDAEKAQIPSAGSTKILPVTMLSYSPIKHSNRTNPQVGWTGTGNNRQYWHCLKKREYTTASSTMLGKNRFAKNERNFVHGKFSSLFHAAPVSHQEFWC